VNLSIIEKTAEIQTFAVDLLLIIELHCGKHIPAHF
jgi:hypothetical protein